MLRKIIANTLVKKMTLFFATFAITGVLMCGTLGDRLIPSLAVSLPLSEKENDGQAPKQFVPPFTPTAKTATPAAPTTTQTTTPQPPDTTTKPEEIPPQQVNVASVTTDETVERPLEPAPPPPVYIAPVVSPADGFVYSSNIPLSSELQKYTYDICVKRGLEYELVLALMWRESRFQIDAINNNTNGTQDSGIMQINDVNRQWLLEERGISDLLDPVQNIDAGTTMLSRYVSKYGVHDALMAYQYGENGMKQKFEQGIVTNDSIATLLEKREDFISIVRGM